MRIGDERIDNTAAITREVIAVPIAAVTDNETDLLVGSFTPGYAFRILAVQAFAAAATDADLMVQIDEVDALDAALEAPDGVTASGVLDAAAVTGDADAVITVLATTADTTGVVTGGVVYVTIQPSNLRIV